ncbi:MAG: ATP-dependent RecD-like DNA helicase [Chitinispirillales bacterium]|jgi:exodeoxyribonuclease V alpha subunit|nr:ATP-dependent RecD-like DNA helicase [Chitinispirillales bacterium]
MERLEGTIESVTYQNEDTGFCVLQVRCASGVYACVGNAPTVRKGIAVTLEGSWTQHRKFGRQFTFESYEISRPTTLEGITQFLESGLVKKIGSNRARLIVEKFGLDTIAILDDDPDRLSEIPGIGAKTLGKIKDSWAQQRHIRGLVLFLQDYDISVTMAARIYKTYGSDAKKKISENPYALIDDVWGIGFVKADAIASKLGFDTSSYKRIKAGLTFALQEAASNGHTFLSRNDIETRSSELLNVSQEQITYTVDHCANEEIFICENDCVYLPYLHKAESFAANDLSSRIFNNDVQLIVKPQEVENFISFYQTKTGWTGAPEQLEAVRHAARSKVFILTGGPGTGKTTVLQVIVALFTHLNMNVQLAAPTGRAAQRMGSISGVTARTIHRLLEFKPGGFDKYRFQKCAENPIDADVIILDEVSMVDIQLMKSFLLAVKKNTTLIFVGDHNQLPSVGPGNILSDMIACKLIPHVQLTRVFRQSAQSRIVTAAHEIINGDIPNFSNTASDNCFLIIEDDPQKCLDTIVDLVNRRLLLRFNLNPLLDIQVLSPMHRGTLGTINLNAALQSILNKNESRINHGQHTFILGDRVIQTRNNYDSGVFNGDIGIITAIVKDTVAVTFDKSPVYYEQKDFDQIIPAYCISIHKSQGSEFKAVIIPVSTQHYIMLQRNLIYTALTRAKDLCVLIGSRNALSIAIRNDKALTRNSRLKERIADGFRLIV